MDYLPEFDELEYTIKDDPDRIELRNLKDVGGMDVAELLTYLYDDGYVDFGPMDATADNGFLMMVKE